MKDMRNERSVPEKSHVHRTFHGLNELASTRGALHRPPRLKRCANNTGAASAKLGPGFLRIRISFNEDRPHTGAISKFNIRYRISYHHAAFCSDRRKVSAGLPEQSDFRLPAVAFACIVLADINAINPASRSRQKLPQPIMNQVNITSLQSRRAMPR